MNTRLALGTGMLALALLLFTPLQAAPAAGAAEAARPILQGADRDAVIPRLSELLKNLPSADFPALVAELRRIPEGLDRSEPGKLVFATWAAIDGPAAFDAALRGPQVHAEAYAAMLAWVLHSPEAPIVHIQSMANRDEKEFATQFLAAAWLKTGPDAALRRSDALPDAAMRAAAMRHVCRTLVISPVPGMNQRAADWISRHTQADYAREAAGIIASSWVVTDAKAAQAWVEKLTPGPVREQAIYELAGSWAGEHPERAQAWLETLPDSEGRQRALDYLKPILLTRAQERQRQTPAP